MYVIFETEEQAIIALQTDNLIFGYPNGSGTEKAWSYFAHGNKFAAMAEDPFLAGHERVGELPE